MDTLLRVLPGRETCPGISTFGAERRGAPVEAFVRVDDSFPNLRCKVVNPYYVIVMGEKLVHSINVAAGIQRGGLMLINSAKDPQAFDFLDGEFQIKTMDVNAPALRNGLGTKTSPLLIHPSWVLLQGLQGWLNPKTSLKEYGNLSRRALKKILPLSKRHMVWQRVNGSDGNSKIQI